MSTTTGNTDKFAYGRNEKEDCVCPAVAAGFHPGGEDKAGMLDAAEYYDNIIQNRMGGYSGVAEQTVAKESWMQMTEQAFNRDYHHKYAALEVAVELGWAEESDFL